MKLQCGQECWELRIRQFVHWMCVCVCVETLESQVTSGCKYAGGHRGPKGAVANEDLFWDA